MHYDYTFINQYIKIPKAISDKVDELYKGIEKRAGVRYCIGLIVTNLLVCGTVAYSQSDRYYAKKGTKEYTKRYMTVARDILLRDKFIFKSKNGSKDIKFKTGISSRITYFEKLEETFPAVKNEINLKKLPLISIDGNPIINKKALDKFLLNINSINNTNKQQSNNKKSNSTKYNTSPLRRYLAISRTLNRDYFNKITLDMSKLNLKNQYLEQIGLTQMFKKGEVGRWYQTGGYSYQQLSEMERRKIIMNGYEVNEVDYSSMHPNILYTWEKKQAPSDIYLSVVNHLRNSGYNTINKDIVKGVILMSFNVKSPAGLNTAIGNDGEDERRANNTRKREGRQVKPVLSDEIKKIGIEPTEIIKAFRSVHPDIGKYAYSCCGNKLMLAESGIMTAVLLELKRRGIPSAPIHDSVLFPKQYANDVKQIMLDEYKKITGFDIKVK